MTTERERVIADLHRDSLTALAHRVVAICLALGVPTILAVALVRSDDDPVVRWGYPPLLVHLCLYAWVILRRPRQAIRFSRVTLALFEVAWLVGVVVQLRSAPDAAAGVVRLFPTSAMGLTIFVVVGFLVLRTAWASVNGAAVAVGVVVAGLVGLLPHPDPGRHVVDVVRFAVALVIITALLSVLSRAKARLAVAVAAAETARDEAHQMRDMAYLDPLTGLANRRRLVEELGHQASHVSIAHPVSVVLFDLDHFKDVNDRHGHGVGDQVLQVVARAAEGVVRGDDVVARLGGEEFVVITPGASVDQARELAERLRTVLPDAVASALGLPVTASFGVVGLEPGEQATAVLARADERMYAAKRAGRDRVAATRGSA